MPDTTAAPKRFLILTAGFGDGHNSAARHLALALEALGHIAEVFDPCEVAVPRLNQRLRKVYRTVTNRYPLVWNWFYKGTNRVDFSKRRNPLMRLIERTLRKKLEQFQPDGCISTYPLYPYFLQRLEKRGFTHLPQFVVVTDSIEINAAWRRAPGDLFLLTDDMTKNVIIGQGLSPSRLKTTGFPVHPDFENLQPLAEDDFDQEPFRIVYFATSRRQHLRRSLRALLQADENVCITVILGRNLRKLFAEAHALKKEFPARIKLKGWTKRVPELMASHHLVVGKAGGATVHEALAARCPMLVHHLVPGQEEGNTLLLQRLGVGALADSDTKLRRELQRLLADHGSQWRHCKRRLNDLASAKSGPRAAQIIANHTPHRHAPTPDR